MRSISTFERISGAHCALRRTRKEYLHDEEEEERDQKRILEILVPRRIPPGMANRWDHFEINRANTHVTGTEETIMTRLYASCLTLILHAFVSNPKFSTICGTTEFTAL